MFNYNQGHSFKQDLCWYNITKKLLIIGLLFLKRGVNKHVMTSNEFKRIIVMYKIKPDFIQKF